MNNSRSLFISVEMTGGREESVLYAYGVGAYRYFITGVAGRSIF